MAFAFRKYFRIKQGETYQTGDYVVCLSDKDWHYGSKVYREYIAPYLDFDHNPEYLQNEYALNQCYNFKRTGKVEHTFKDIPLCLRRQGMGRKAYVYCKLEPHGL